jgi:hypothetical protein
MTALIKSGKLNMKKALKKYMNFKKNKNNLTQRGNCIR